MTEVKGNGSSKKLLPEILEEYLWREILRKEGGGATASNSIFIHIVELHSEER